MPCLKRFMTACCWCRDRTEAFKSARAPARRPAHAAAVSPRLPTLPLPLPLPPQMLPPVILASLGDGVAGAKQRALSHLATTHDSRKLAGYAEVRGMWVTPSCGGGASGCVA